LFFKGKKLLRIITGVILPGKKGPPLGEPVPPFIRVGYPQEKARGQNIFFHASRLEKKFCRLEKRNSIGLAMILLLHPN
jgi:hypothetical protein